MTLRDTSEAIRNIVTAAAVLVGGAWTLYQWDTLFPKTDAEVVTAAATIRADVSGTFGLSFPYELGAAQSFDDGEAFEGWCTAHPGEAFYQRQTAVGSLALKSGSAAPLRIAVTDLEMARVAPPAYGLAAGKPEVPVEALATEASGAPLPPEAFVGGLDWSRIEQGQEVSTAFLATVNLPFTCPPEGAEAAPTLFVFTAVLSVSAIDPRTGAVAGTVPKRFVRACPIAPGAAGGICDMESIVGVGQ